MNIYYNNKQMPTTNWKAKCISTDKQRRVAWAKYFEELNRNHDQSVQRFIKVKEVVETEATPQFIIDELKEMYDALKKEVECPICMEVIPHGKIEITKCGHKFCKDCYDKLVATSNECAMCRKQIKWVPNQ